MGRGLGIHGEPGIADHPLPRASELAALLVEGVLADAPEGEGTRVAAILNGLGRTKYEERFIVWSTASRLLREAGLEIVEPEVGELVTSLDMARCWLTPMWLDGELEQLWTAPADTPAYRKGGVVTSAEGELGRIDAVARDGDHGRGISGGSSTCHRTFQSPYAAAPSENRSATADLAAGPARLMKRLDAGSRTDTAASHSVSRILPCLAPGDRGRCAARLQGAGEPLAGTVHVGAHRIGGRDRIASA
jgi:D-erythrulose 4-kinase